jgi:hypothetical protein
VKNKGVWARTSCGIQFVTPTTMHWPCAMEDAVSEVVEWDIDEETHEQASRRARRRDKEKP